MATVVPDMQSGKLQSELFCPSADYRVSLIRMIVSMTLGIFDDHCAVMQTVTHCFVIYLHGV
jgi:hypothetical protein